MRLKVKNIGSELSLDEYNAYQYLLYNMTCWKERIYLNTYTSYQGKYANYLLKENDNILPEKNENITIIKEFNKTNPSLILQLSNNNTTLTKNHTTYNITLHIKKPQNNGTIQLNYTDENGNNTTLTETSQTHPIDNPEINQILQQEAHALPNIETDYDTITIPSTYNPTNNTIEIPLYQNNQPLLPINTIISTQIDIQLQLNTKPYIDINNGRPNEINEILIDNPHELFLILHYAPTDSTKTIIRLDSNNQYLLENTLTIKNGQNIEIRGGTNTKAILDGTNIKRSIIIKPGGQLTLKNITLQNNNSNQTGVYDKGKGGAILVESQTNKNNTTFGVLECDNCLFKNNNAGTGGAIYSYHAGIYINNCTFQNNTANNGGAIYYYSQDITMTMKDIYAKAGEKITAQCTIKNYLGKNITTGTIKYYTTLDKQEYTAPIKNGIAQLTYNIPTNIKEKQFNITAIYQGSNTTDPEVIKNTVYIKTKEEYTLLIENPPETICPGEWLILTATVTNSNKEITNLPNAIFNYNNTTINYTRTNNKYQIKKQIPTDTKEDIKIQFKLEPNEDYTSNTASTTIKILEKPNQTLDGYITGLIITNNNKTSTQIDTLISKGITDIYINHDISLLLNCENIKLQKTSTGSNVTKLQTILKQLGYYNNTIDGDFGAVTKSAVTKFQKDNSLLQDGIVGPVTCKALNQKITQPTYNLIKITENKTINTHIIFNLQYDLTKTSSIEKQIDELIKYKIKGFVFHNLRYNGTSDKIKNQMSWTINETTKVSEVTKTIKTLNNYIKNKGNYTTSITVMPEEEYNAKAYGQNYKELSQNTDYLIPILHEPEWNQNEKWVERVIKYINSETNNTNIIAQLMTHTDDKNPTNTKRSTTELTNTINTLVKQNKVKGYILYHEAGITDYPSPYKKLMEDK